MDIILVIVIVTIIYGLYKGRGNNGFTREQTTTVNGVFVLLVFMSHFQNYYGQLNDGIIYPLFQTAHGQLVVVPFFLFSGYGVMSSIQLKEEKYSVTLINKIPLLLLKFDICVLLFILLNKLLRIQYSINQVLLSFLSVVEIGNSNWFITSTLVIYAIVAFSFIVEKNNYYKAIVITTFLLVIYAFTCIYYRVPPRFYNTVLAFPLGMYIKLSGLVDKCSALSLKKYIIFIVISLILSFAPAMISLFYKTALSNYFVYVIRTISFCSLILLFLSHFGFHSSVFKFLGNHVFSVYMLQRLPMIMIYRLSLLEEHTLLRLSLCFLITIIISLLIEKVFGFIDRLFNRSIA